MPEPSSQPLLYQSDIQYIGAFRVPSGTVGESNYTYNSQAGGGGLAYNLANNSLFLSGFYADSPVGEISIPSSIVNSSNVDDLATASSLQPLIKVIPRLPVNIGSPGGNDAVLGGLQVTSGQLIGTDYGIYDTSGTTILTHFRFDSLTLSTAQVEGMFEVSAGQLGGGAIGASGAAAFYAGYMAPIPSEWQSLLGAPYLTGNAMLSIINRTSSGPAAFGFDPSSFATGFVTPATPYVYYTQTYQLGGGDLSSSNNPYFINGCAQVNAVVFLPGTRSVLFFGSIATNTMGYGIPSAFNDPYRPGTGWHSQNGDYAYHVWAYDANDFVAVKNGQSNPWDLVPYAQWNIDFPQFGWGSLTGGTTLDSSTGRLYLVENQADSGGLPLIQVMQVNLPAVNTNAAHLRILRRGKW